MAEENQQALSAYNTHQHAEPDDRETDKRMLLMAANKLRQALENKGQNIDMYREAIRFNQRIWTMFQVALVDAENKLPDDLKITLLSLSKFVDRSSFSAITTFNANLVTSLMDIDLKIAKGLAVRPASAQPQTQQPMTIDQPPPSGQSSVMISA